MLVWGHDHGTIFACFHNSTNVFVLLSEVKQYTRDEKKTRHDMTRPAEIFTVLDTTKENDSCERIEQHQQKHSHDDEEAFEHRHNYCQHQHLQSGLQTQHTHHWSNTTRLVKYQHLQSPADITHTTGQTQHDQSNTTPPVRHNTTGQTLHDQSNTAQLVRHNTTSQTQHHWSNTTQTVRHNTTSQTQHDQSNTTPPVRHNTTGQTQHDQSNSA